ncbi:MAG: ATP-binding protein [Candidatus Omnitrophota bacterium]|nr:ATP-binding protein [Candidatus Omnitrophota bacterium]
MSIRQKLILGFITVALLPCLTIMAFSILNLEKITKDLRNIQESGVNKLKSAGQMANELAGIEALLKECLLEKIEIGPQEVIRTKNKVEEGLLRFEQVIRLEKELSQKREGKESGLLKTLEEKYLLYKKGLIQTIEVFGKKSYVAIDRFYETQVEKIAKALLLDIRQFQENAEGETQIEIKQIQEAGRLMTDSIVFISIIVLLLALALSFFIAHSLSNPIRRLMSAALEIGRGNLGMVIKIKSKDEIGALAQSFNRMSVDLKSSQGQLLEAKKEIENYSKDLEEKVRERGFALSTLYEVSNAISYTLDYQTLLNLIMESLFKLVDYDICGSLLFDESGVNITMKPVYPQSIKFIDEVKEGLINSTSLLSKEDIRKEGLNVVLIPADREIAQSENRGFDKLRSFFNVPFLAQGKVIGIINVSSCRENAFSGEDIKLIYTIANQASNAIERLKLVITAEKSKMESMVESMSEGVIMIDSRGEVVVFNPQARRMLSFGFRQEISAKVLDEKMQKIGLYEALKESKDKGKPLIKEITVMVEDEGMVLRSDVSSVKNEKGEIVGTVIILRDITKEKEVDKMKSEFISIVSHELRTPLSVTKEGISLVLDGVTGMVNVKQEKVLLTARNNIDRLTDIINSLLDISKIEAGRTEIRKRLVNFNSLINELISSFSKRAKDKGLELKVLLPEKTIEVYVDPEKVNQVFINLVTNAIKFTKEGCVEIKAEEKENEIECVVTDTGVGISKEDLPKVFGKFQQFERTPGAGEKGTGLGLSIAKAIVELHKGKIWVESQLGVGTKFTFVLPKYTVQEFFKEYVNNGISRAIEDNTKMSLIVVSLAEFDRLKERLPEPERKQLLKNMEEVLQNSLRRAGDVAVRDTGELVVILNGCDKEAALRVEGRLAQMLEDTLNQKEATKGISLRFGCATYPDEARVDEDLLKKAKSV